MASAQNKPQAAQGLVLERFLPYRLSVLSNRISRAIAKRYAQQFDLTIPEWRVIAVLGRAQSLSATEIGDATAMDKVAVSRAVARLMRARRLTARCDPHDARRQSLALSAAGQSLYARIAPLALEVERQLIASLSQAEQAQLDVIVQRLSKAAALL
jgi:DNA-binding MarR family transcriptional regulator